MNYLTRIEKIVLSIAIVDAVVLLYSLYQVWRFS